MLVCPYHVDCSKRSLALHTVVVPRATIVSKLVRFRTLELLLRHRKHKREDHGHDGPAATSLVTGNSSLVTGKRPSNRWGGVTKRAENWLFQGIGIARLGLEASTVQCDIIVSVACNGYRRVLLFPMDPGRWIQ